jgi:signal transduction histidine kinase
MRVFGLRGKLLLAFMFMALLTILCAATAIYSAGRSISLFADVAAKTLPSLRFAERLARQSEKAMAQIVALAAAQSENERQDLDRRWTLIEQDLAKTLDDANGLGAFSTEIGILAINIDRLKELRQRLDTTVRDLLAISSDQRTRRRAFLSTHQKFQDILEPVITIARRVRLGHAPISDRDARLMINPALIEPAAGPVQGDRLGHLLQLQQMNSDLANILLSVEQEDRPQHLKLAVIRARSHHERVQALLPSLEEGLSGYLAELNDQILDFGSGDQGLPALRQRLLASEKRVVKIRASALLLAQQVEDVIGHLVQETSGAFDRDEEGFRQAQYQMLLLVLAAAASSVLVTLGIGAFYLQRQLVQPIVTLADAIKSFEHGAVMADGLGQGKDEIGELGRAFVDMTKERQRAEVDLAERNELLATANDQLEHANVELERSNRELDSFAYIAAHDLKEPLRAIRNHAAFLQEDHGEHLGDDGKKRLDRLIDLGQRMDRLISDLLYYARLGRGEQASEPVDLSALINDIEAHLADMLEAQNAVIIRNEGLPRVIGNRAQLTALFQNLIVNGVKYNDALEKRIEIGLETGAGEDANDVLIYVRDNGIGIEDKFHQDVFKIFKRLKSEKAYGAGTGAGLSFVQKIVDNHGGRIWLESDVGAGTTFFFTLKRAA